MLGETCVGLTILSIGKHSINALQAHLPSEMGGPSNRGGGNNSQGYGGWRGNGGNGGGNGDWNQSQSQPYHRGGGGGGGRGGGGSGGAATVMKSLSKAMSRQFEQAEEAQALAVMQQMFTGKATSAPPSGGLFAPAVSPLAQLAGMYAIPQAGLASPPQAQAPAPPATTPPTAMDLLPFFAAAASNTNSEFEKEALAARHMLQRVSASAAEISQASVAPNMAPPSIPPITPSAAPGCQLTFDRMF